MNLLGFFRLTRLRFIEKTHESGDIYTFHFKPARPLKHRAGEHGVFYLSGSPKFVFATKKTLRGLGIGWRRVKADTFLGY